MCKCKVCRETSLFMEKNIELSKDNTLTVRVRYDFDCDDRNEFDIEVIEYLKDSNSTNTDWTYSFNTKYCPICGRKLDNQRDDAYKESNLVSSHIMIDKTYDWRLVYDNETHSIHIIFNYNELSNSLELWVYIDNNLKGFECKKINYDPVTGEELVD